MVEDIVFVAVDKVGYVAYYCQDIEFIPLDSVIGQEDIMELQVEQMVPHSPHHLIGLHVVHVQDIEVVETAIKGLTYLKAKVHHCIEDTHFLKLDHSHQVLYLVHPWTYTF